MPAKKIDQQNWLNPGDNMKGAEDFLLIILILLQLLRRSYQIHSNQQKWTS